MENTSYSYDLYHHGTKGMRWGIRRYQNKDGSLTPAGQKRYNKEVEKLKKETAKVKAAETAAANRKKTQNKFERLEAKKQALEARKKALKSGKDPDEIKKQEAEALKRERESIEEKRARLLKSSDAKELYENRDLLTTQELTNRIDRIDTEAKLKSRIVEVKQKTGKDYFDDAVKVYKTLDQTYDTFMGSSIGKSVLKKLGLEEPKKTFDIKKAWEKVDEYDDDTLSKISSRVEKRNKIKKAYDDEIADEEKAAKAAERAKADKKAEKEAKEAEKEAEKAEKKAEKEAKKTEKESAKSEKGHKDDTDGKVYGKGTSHSDIKDRMDNGKKWWDTSDVYETVDFTSGSSDRGRNFYNTLLLEDKSRR